MTFDELKEVLVDHGFGEVPWDGDDSVLDHCLNVADTASTIAKLIARRGYPIDVEHCGLGGLLHDFAVPMGDSLRHIHARTRSGLLQHRSYEVLSELIQSGEFKLDAHDVVKGTLATPHKFASPMTIEEKVIAFADWVNHPGPAKLPTPSPVWNSSIQSFGPLGTTERELARLTGVSNLWAAFAAHRIV